MRPPEIPIPLFLHPSLRIHPRPAAGDVVPQRAQYVLEECVELDAVAAAVGIDDFVVEGGGVEGRCGGAVRGVVEAEIVEGDGGEVVPDELGEIGERGGGEGGGGQMDVG